MKKKHEEEIFVSEAKFQTRFLYEELKRAWIDNVYYM